MGSRQEVDRIAVYQSHISYIQVVLSFLKDNAVCIEILHSCSPAVQHCLYSWNYDWLMSGKGGAIVPTLVTVIQSNVCSTSSARITGVTGDFLPPTAVVSPCISK